jgi:hypothetical protein
LINKERRRPLSWSAFLGSEHIIAQSKRSAIIVIPIYQYGIVILMRKILNIVIYIFAGIGFMLVLVYLALQLGLTNTKGIIDNQHDYFKNQKIETNSWQNTEEWQVLKSAIIKDKDVINKAAIDSGVSSRLIVSILIVEQLRLFNSEREIFKQVFAPLKILGNQSQFSWGVMGIKQDTAKEIENRLNKNNHILDFKTNDPDSERFARLTDEKDRYYSYLYAGLLIKELKKQWSDTGFDISNKPGVIATLYNIGFANSKPNSNPQIGGAEIEINKTTYSFGGLAQSFYESDELVGEFSK